MKRSRIISMAAGSRLTLLFTIWALLMLWASKDLGEASARVPRLVLFVTLVCLLLQLAKELRTGWALSSETPVLATDGRLGRTMAAIAWLALLLLFTWLFGVALASAFFCLAWLRWHAGENWPVSLAMSAGLGLVLWAAFSALPGTSLYSGVLWSLV